MRIEDIERAIGALKPLLEGDEASFEAGARELRQIDAQHPDDARVQYLIGSAYDSHGREALAIQHYDKVFALGVAKLPDSRQPELFVQAGSTLRNLGRFAAARETFATGITRHPDYRALRVFAALNDMSAGDAPAAAKHLLAFALMPHDASIDRFRRSLTWYIGQVSAE